MPLTLWNDEATKEIEELRLSYQERLQSAFGQELTLEVDGSSFLTHNAFQSKDDNDKLKLVKGLLDSFTDTGLFADKDGLKTWLEKSERAKAQFSEQVQAVILSFAPDNSVDSKIGNGYYQIRYEDQKIQAKVRLDCIGYTDGWGSKVDKQMSLNVNAEVAQKQAESIRVEQEEKINEALGAQLELIFDWDFMTSPQFEKLDDSARDKLILGLAQKISQDGLFKGDEGFVDAAKKSPRILNHFLNQLDSLVVSLEPSNTVDSKIGNGYYQIRHEDRRLIVKVRMDCVGYTDGWGEKTDFHLNARWLEEQAMTQCLKTLQTRMEQFNEAVGAEIQCEVHWASFLDSETFKNYDKSKRKTTIEGLSDSVAQLGLLEKGGLKEWCEQTARGRQKLLESISLIRLELAPDNTVDSKTGNGYYQIRVDGPVLIVRTRLDCVGYTDGWGEKVDLQLAVNGKGEIAIRQAEEKLKTLNERLQNESGQDLEVVVNWSSFIQSDKDQTKELLNIVDQVVDQGLFASNGALSFFQETKEAADHVKYLVVSFEPNNTVDSKAGNGYYQVRVVDGAVQVLVRADCVGYTDGWGEKLKFHSESVLAATRNENNPVELFEYLQPLAELNPAPPAEPLEQHPLLAEHEEFQTRELTPEELAAREERKRQAQLRREQAEQKAKEAEAARKAEAERQAKKLREAQEKMRAALGQANTVSENLHEIDAEAPEIEGAEGIQSELKEQNSAWGSLLSCQTQFELDWSFKDHDFFKSASESEKKEILDKIRSRVLNSALGTSSGLGALVKSDEIYKNWAMAFAARVVIAIDGENSICSKVSNNYAEHYELTLPSSGTLLVRINENKLSEGLYNLAEHVKVLANVETMIAMREMTKFANEQSQELSRATETVIETEIDFDFIFSPEFQTQASDVRIFAEIKKQREDVEKLRRMLNFISESSESIGKRCLADDVMKAAVAEKISKIHISLDPQSSINDRTVGDEYSKNYSLELEDESKTLRFVCNLNYLDSPYRFTQRFDEVIQVRVQQAQRDCLNALKELFSKQSAALGRDLQWEIVWSFCDHEAFISKSLDEKKDLILKIANRWMPELLSEQGLTTKDTVMQGAMRERIESLRFVIDPAETIDSPVGGSYANHYTLELEGKQLLVSYNMNNTNNLYNITTKFDELLDVRVAQSQLRVESILKEKIQDLESAVGKKIEVAILWESFTGESQFLELDLKERGEVTELVVTKIAANLLTDTAGLCSLAKGESSSKAIIHDQVDKVTIAIDCTDSIDDSDDGDYAKHYKVEFAEGCLSVVSNLTKLRDGLYRLEEKLDRVLHFETAKQLRIGRETVLPGLKTAMKSSSLDIDLDFKIDTTFTESDSWKMGKIAEKRDGIQGLFNTLKVLVEDGEKGFQGAFEFDDPNVELLKKHVNTVVIGYEYTGLEEVPDDWHYADEYQLNLQDSGELVIRASHSIRRGQIYGFPNKLIPQLHFTEQRLVTYGRDWQFASHKSEEILGQACPVSFDWGSLDNGGFLYRQSLEDQAERLKHLHRSPEGAVGGFRKLIKAIGSNPASREAFLENVEAIQFTVEADGDEYPLSIEEGMLKLSLPMELIEEAVPFKTWLMNIEWRLQSLIAANQFRANRRIPKFQSHCAELLGKEMPVAIDWTDFESEAYLERGPEQIVRDFDTLSGALMKSILIQGIAAVAEHPLGKSTIHEEIESVRVVYQQEMTYTGWSEGRTDSQVEIVDKVLVISTDNLVGAAECAYKSRIEFCLDLIVKIAAANSKPKREAVQAALSELLGQPLTLDVELEFSQTDEFKRQTPEAQSALVTLLASSWYEDVLNQDIGLKGLIRHEPGLSSFKAGVEVVTLTSATPEKALPVEGQYSWDQEKKSITLTVPFKHDLALLQSPRSYARLAESLTIDQTIIELEASEILASTQNGLNEALGAERAIRFDWDFWGKDPQWLAIRADDRQLYAHSLARGLEKALLGYRGLVGPAEFQSSRDAMLGAFNEILVRVDLGGNHEGRVSQEGESLVVSISLSQLKNEEFRGLRYDVEKQLQLKPLMEAAVRAEVDETLSKLDFSFSAKLQLDWDHFAQQDEYQSEADFVALTREVGRLPRVALKGDEGLSWLASENSACKQKLEALQGIQFRVDLSNLTRPPQVRFVPMFYKCEVAGDQLTLTMRREAESDRGCGMVLEFQLDALEAERKEEAHIQKIADKRRADEIDRRERETRRIQRENQSAQASYASAVKRYDMAFKEYEKKKARPHRLCDGTGRKTCGNMWHDGRSKMRKCHTCNGKGWIRCVGCSGTGKHYPRIKPPTQPNPPVDESIPNWEPISSINWRAGI